MKKSVLLILFLLLIFFSACQKDTNVVTYSDDDPIILNMGNDVIKILQITDLHLTFGFDANDRKTFSLIEKLVKSDDFDLVVISGDMTLSITAPNLFSMLVKHMESLETPWTFVFGNHESDFHGYHRFIDQLSNTEYLQFKVGPELVDGGYGNFIIQFEKDGQPFYRIYLLDSKAERSDYTEEEGIYDYLSEAQVTWYEQHVSLDVDDSIVFMHIPLRQFIDPIDYIGIFDEDQVYAQGVDTGFFDVMVTYGKTKGVFVGHDHLNDFYVIKEGIYLAYGRISGYNAYGNLERGGRVIEIDSEAVMTSYVLLESEVD
ncbi:MAG: metallophosphoesterase [Acholeplasmataceae bacterium]|nr:metallophosphoesterase [Acholeplasmataceae bacterium]